MVFHILLGTCCRESNTLCFYLHSSSVAMSNYREYGQAISNEHVVSGESINSSKIVSTVTCVARGEQINEGSCIWKPLLQATFCLAISHYPSQRSAARRLFEADFKHLMKRSRAGSRISVKWVLWRGSSCHPKAPASELHGAAAFPKGKVLQWGPGYHSQQHASRGSTISWPALRSQLQSSSQNGEKHNLSQCPSKGYMSLDYGTSLQHMCTSYKEYISEQSLSQTETGHWDLKTEQMQWVTQTG